MIAETDKIRRWTAGFLIFAGALLAVVQVLGK